MRRWLLLRGLTRETRHWGDFPALLQDAVGAAAVVPVDLPGNGALHARESPADIVGMTAACRQEVQRCGLAPPFGVVAMSLGAMVATEWAARHPAEIGAAVLVNTSMRPFSPFFHRLRPRNYPALLRLLMLESDGAAIERTILALTSRARAGDAGLLADWGRWRAQYPVSRRNALRQLRAAALYRAPAAAPATPMLLLAGAGDRLVDSRCSERIAAAWGKDFACHPWAGHDLPLDDPAWVARQVMAWCASTAGR